VSTGQEPSEEELQAAYEAEIKRLRVEQVLLEQVVSLVNLGMRRTGLTPGTEDEQDVGQVRLAIEAVRALLPLLENAGAPQVGAIRDALSQLQLAFVRLGGSPDAGAAPSFPGAGAPGAGAPGAGAGAPGAGAGARSAGAGAAPSGGPGPGQAPPAGAQPQPQPEAPKPGEAGPAQRSGRLWIPGQ
jgi:hypothetical protein